jgi:hypothetical protein
VTDELPVDINREGLHELDVPASFEATESFDVVLVNHGESLHVHLHLDDTLSEVASIDAGNHYVEADSERRVRVDANTDALDEESLRGKLKVASGYGAQTRWIDVEMREPDPESESVRVDESLAQPQPSDPEPESVVESPEIPVLALAAVALLVAALTAVIIGELLIFLGTLVVLVGVIVGLYFLLQEE